MINFKMIYKVLGLLLYIEAFLMLWCLVMSFHYQEDDLAAFAISVVTTVLAGCVMRFMGRDVNNSLSRREAYLVVTLAWVVFSLFGTMPFLISGYVSNFTDAFFETMSGFTTTGATIISDVEALPHGLLFWRSLMQWVGGLGIVFFTIALLPSFVGGSVQIFAAEATGPMRTKLHPRLTTNTKAIWMIFTVLTIGCIATYKLLGMGWFDSVNYAMTMLATGGFAPHNDSILHFQSAPIEYASVIFCFLSGINFTLLYCVLIKFDFKSLVKNSEVKFYIAMIVVATLFIIAELMARNGYSIENAFRSALFQVVSLVTTTGLFNDNVADWPRVTWLILIPCMFIGACSGSTSSGIKCVRGVMLLKIVRNEFRQILHPNAVLPLKVNGVNIPQQKRVTLLALFTLYLTVCFISLLILMAIGIDSTDAISITLGSVNNIGQPLSSGAADAVTWATLPIFAKWMCTMLMLMGRLEIFNVLVIFTSAYWHEN